MRFHYIERSLLVFFFTVGSLLIPWTLVWGFGDTLRPSNRDEKLNTPECVKSRSGKAAFSRFQEAADSTEVYAFENILTDQSSPCSGRIVLTKASTEGGSNGLNILIPDARNGVEEYSGLVPELRSSPKGKEPKIYALEVNSKGTTTEMIEYLIRRKDERDAAYIDELFAIDKSTKGPPSNHFVKLVKYVNSKPKPSEISGIYYKKKGQGIDEDPGYVIDVFQDEKLPKKTFRLLESKGDSVLWVTPVDESGRPSSPPKVAIFTSKKTDTGVPVIMKYEIQLTSDGSSKQKNSNDNRYIQLMGASTTLARKATPEEISRLSFNLTVHSAKTDEASSERSNRSVSPELLGQ